MRAGRAPAVRRLRGAWARGELEGVDEVRRLAERRHQPADEHRVGLLDLRLRPAARLGEGERFEHVDPPAQVGRDDAHAVVDLARHVGRFRFDRPPQRARGGLVGVQRDGPQRHHGQEQERQDQLGAEFHAERIAPSGRRRRPPEKLRARDRSPGTPRPLFRSGFDQKGCQPFLMSVTPSCSPFSLSWQVSVTLSPALKFLSSSTALSITGAVFCSPFSSLMVMVFPSMSMDTTVAFTWCVLPAARAGETTPRTRAATNTAQTTAASFFMVPPQDTSGYEPERGSYFRMRSRDPVDCGPVRPAPGPAPLLYDRAPCATPVSQGGPSSRCRAICAVSSTPAPPTWSRTSTRCRSSRRSTSMARPSSPRPSTSRPPTRVAPSRRSSRGSGRPS